MRILLPPVGFSPSTDGTVDVLPVPIHVHGEVLARMGYVPFSSFSARNDVVLDCVDHYVAGPRIEAEPVDSGGVHVQITL